MDVLGRLKDRKKMFVSFEGRNDRLIFDSHDEIESLRAAVERLRDIVKKGERLAWTCRAVGSTLIYSRTALEEFHDAIRTKGTTPAQDIAETTTTEGE